MDEGGHRYCYSLLRRHVWRDMWKPAGPVWFWQMWGVRKALRFMVTDTIEDSLGFIERQKEH